MGTTLTNGVYLPDEGERNCYAGLKTNWEILDQKVADITALQQAVAGALHREIVESLPTTDIDPNTIYMILSGTSATENVYNEFMYVNNAWELIGTSATDLTNYYTKAEVDGKLLLKANASDLTSHTGDSTIHVTANDKTKWNTLALIKHLRLVNAQVGSATTIPFSDFDDTNGIKVGDKCADLDVKVFEITAVDTANQNVTVSPLLDIALDANVLHNSGNEDVNGTKTFKDMIPIDGDYLGNESSVNARTTMCLRSNRDTVGKSGVYVVKYRPNKAQGSMGDGDLVYISFDVLENQVRTNAITSIQCSGWVDNVPTKVKIVSGISDSSFGSSVRPSKINDLEPSALGMPDLNSGVDISNYVDVTQTSQYTAPANGYISICGYATSTNAILIKDHDYDFAMTFRDLTTSLGATTYFVMPVIKNHVYDISCSAVTAIDYAKFFPCLGNV